jgi:PadR family transcriptional regulator, regulatory protein PadR
MVRHLPLRQTMNPSRLRQPPFFYMITSYLVIHCIDMKRASAPDPASGDKWEVQLRKGCLELAILAALWDGKLYGLSILRQLEDDSDLIISEGTVYPLLSRLKSLGLVQSEWVESDGGHPRKYYALTLAGRHRVREMAGMWTRFSSSMSRLLAPVGKGK